MNKIILGLGHYSRTGKDTFANEVVRTVNDFPPVDFVAGKKPFAWKLKQICHELYGWAGLREPEYYDTKEGEPFRDVKIEPIGKTPVEIWVAMGTPAVRENVYQDTWIDYLLNTDHGLNVLVIPDVRFPNEVAAIRRLGGKLIKVVRPGYGPRNTVADKALVGFTGWDYVFGAHGDIDYLRREAYEVAVAILGHGAWPVQTDEQRQAAMSVEKVTV